MTRWLNISDDSAVRDVFQKMIVTLILFLIVYNSMGYIMPTEFLFF